MEPCLTEYGLDTLLFYAILPRMNGFRITILTLLCLSVALMFYVVLYVIPGWQEEYNTYQAVSRISEYDKKSDIHLQQMQALDPSVETPEQEQARLAAEEEARRSEISLQEAEESVILAAAKRREEAAQAKARAEAEAKAAEAAKAAAQPQAVGIVASFDPEWNCVMIKPAVVSSFTQGAVLAVSRQDVVLCEVVVDGMDAESGQISATVKVNQIDSTDGVLRVAPAAGDKVIVSPFLSGADLRAHGDASPQDAMLPETATPAAEAVVPEALPQPPAAPAEPDALPAAPAEPAAPVPDEMQRALDAVPSAPRSNSALPSLDDRLQSPLL